jgi:SAM-dependent methyltransferase
VSNGSDFADPASEIGADAAKIRKNAFLEEIYISIYRKIVTEIPPERFPRLLELGSGGGFFSEFAPHAKTSECVPVPGIDLVVDACAIDQQFAPGELDAIAAFNVFHHLPDAAGFLRGASRVLRPGGRICLVEPWFTSVGQWFYRAIHHEPSILNPDDWSIAGEGRLTGANSRLPTSVFRDSPQRFAREFPALTVQKIEPFHKWLYLFSGGLRLNTHLPRFLAKRLVDLDGRVAMGNDTFGLFALVVLERAQGDDSKTS